MQTRRGRRGAWKCRVSKYRVLFLFIGWRDAKLLSTYSLSSSSSFFYRITRYFLSFFFFFLVDPPCVCRETEGDIQRNTRFCTSTKKVFFILLSPRYLRKTCAQTFAGGKKSCFVDASPFIRATTFNRDTRPFLLRLFRGKRKIAET